LGITAFFSINFSFLDMFLLSVIVKLKQLISYFFESRTVDIAVPDFRMTSLLNLVHQDQVLKCMAWKSFCAVLSFYSSY
jgi:hypothetical protein